VANEAIVNIRTVASLTKEPKFVADYSHLIGIPQKYVFVTLVTQNFANIFEAMPVKYISFYGRHQLNISCFIVQLSTC